MRQLRVEYGRELLSRLGKDGWSLDSRRVRMLEVLVDRGVMGWEDSRVFGNLSKVFKMPEYSFSLPRVEACPGAWDTNESGRIVGLCDVCQCCYGAHNRYLHRPVVVKLRERMGDWKRPEWVLRMVVALLPRKWHRWHDVGDICCPEYAEKLIEVCKKTPYTHHWIPTKTWRVPWAASYLKELASLKNVTVRWSGTKFVRGRVKEFGEDVVLGGVVLKGRAPAMVDLKMASKGEYVICPAHWQGNKCGPCRVCWDKDVRMVAYPYH